MARGPVTFGIGDEIGVAIGQAEILEAHVGLLPADHPVGIVAQDQHGEIEPEADRGFHLLAVHHEAAVAADRHDLALRVKHRAHHRARQACTHRRQRVVEQDGVGQIGGITAREPDLVDPVVETDDPVFGHAPTHLLHQMRREDREARVPGKALRVRDFSGAVFEHPLEIPAPLRDDVFLDLPDCVGDVADHLDLREIDRIDLGGLGRDMDHRGRAVRTDRAFLVIAHEEGRLFDHVVADIDDTVRVLDRAVDEIARRQRRAAEEQRVAFVDHALAHLGGDEGDAGLVDQLPQHPPGHLAIGARPDDEDRLLRLFDRHHRLTHGLGLGTGTARQRRGERAAGGLFLGNVLGKFEMHRAGLFLLGQPDRLTHAAGDVVGAGELVGVFGDRAHHRDHVKDLEPALLRFLDRLLPGDRQCRHPAELRIGHRRHHVGRARAQCRQEHAGLSGVAAIGRRHEARALFVTGQDQLDLVRMRQAFEKIEVLLARHAEDIFDTLRLETLDEEV